MIVYKDITFCTCSKCLNQLCKIRLTDEVKQAAREEGLPYAAADRSKQCRYFVGDESCNGTETAV